MIKIQNFRAMMLSCHIGTISILTDKEYIDVNISTSQTGNLLSERYYATDGKVMLYDLRSLVEQAMRPSGLAVMQLYFEAYVDIPDDHSEDYDRSGFMVIYCDRDIDIFDFEPLPPWPSLLVRNVHTSPLLIHVSSRLIYGPILAVLK